MIIFLGLDQTGSDYSLYELIIEFPRALPCFSKRTQNLDQVVWDKLIELDKNHTLQPFEDLVLLLLVDTGKVNDSAYGLNRESHSSWFHTCTPSLQNIQQFDKGSLQKYLIFF